jgi:hypothetical protein
VSGFEWITRFISLLKPSYLFEKDKKLTIHNSGHSLRSRSTLFIVALTLSALATAEDQTNTTPSAEKIYITWSASTGLGYDSNAYQSPRYPYVDYAASSVSVFPEVKSGIFVPYQAKLDIAKNRQLNSRLLGTTSLDGKFYPGNGLSEANTFNVELSGGSEYVLSGEKISSDSIYVGALFEKHENVYVDHESGSSKTTTMTGAGIDGRTSYMGIGVEGKYARRAGNIDYSINGQYILNDYQDTGVVSQFDHSYFALDAEASIPINHNNALILSYDHTVRNYSGRHARDAQGTETISSPMLAYTYNGIGAKWSSQISPDWMLLLDYDHTRRADNYQSYDESRENGYGMRLSYEQGRLKTRLDLHHWVRDYPNGFAFDVAGQGAKTYRGNILELRAELEQPNNTALWTELYHKTQNSSDLRYDYARMLIMAGMSWAY